MKVYTICNALFVRVQKEEPKYFLLDSGGMSFSPEFSRITSDDIGAEVDFSLSLNSSWLVDLRLASRFFGIPIVGFLGREFFDLFENILLHGRGREVRFNVSSFDATSSIPFGAMASFKEGGEQRRIAIDTGSFACMNFSHQNYHGPRSAEFIMPSVGRDLHINYAMMGLEIDGHFYGEVFTGLPKNFGDPGLHILGASFLEKYECLWDKENKKLFLKESTKPQIFPTNPTHSFRIQVEMVDHQIVVSHVLNGCPLDVKKGDIITLPGIDMEDPEIMNTVYERLVFKTDGNPVRMAINGKEGEYTPVSFFE